MSSVEEAVKDIKYICHMPDEVISSDEVRSFMEEIHAIDVSVYSPEDAGEVEPMVSRYAANPESYIYVRDDSGHLVGYLNFFPVKKELQNFILSPDTPYSMLDDAIPPEQISPYKKKKEHFIYVLSAAIMPAHQGGEVIRLLTDGMIRFLHDRHVHGYRISSIAACAVSDGGSVLSERMRMHPHHTLAPDGEDEHPKTIYIADNSDGDGITKAGALNKLLYKGPDVRRAESGHLFDEKETFRTETAPDGTVIPGDEYIKTWKDDIFLYLPMTEHAANDSTDPLFEGVRESTVSGHYPAIDPDQPIKTDDPVPDIILSNLEETIRYECSSQSIRDMSVHYLGCYYFLHTDDQYPCKDHSYDPIHDDVVSIDPAADPEHRNVRSYHDAEQMIRDRLFTYPLRSRPEIEKRQGRTDLNIYENISGLPKGYVFITAHRPTHMYVVNVFFPEYRYCTSQIEDQVSNNYIKIVDPRTCDDPYKNPDDIRFIRLYDYLWEKYSLHRCGQEKIMVCMSDKPDENVYKTEFENILSAEVYNSRKQGFHVHSRKLTELCNTDNSQYDYYRAYLSEKVIAFIPHIFGPQIERIELTSTYSFIVELIMFQNTALARMNSKVSDLLYRNNKVTMDEVTELEQEYGKTIPFWEPSNFNYIGTAEEATCIKKAFSNDELLATYNKHQDYLEHMVDLMASERENRNAMILNIAATVLAVIQVESFITDILGDFYATAQIEVASRYSGFGRSFSHTLMGSLLLIVFYLIIRNNRRKKERKLREGKSND
ncbi:MAG: hypothetical protein K5673_10910 [Lachnospiraceae bacterium]|nr:hypothetical protein [Lachnospiraceae bacterium]